MITQEKYYIYKHTSPSGKSYIGQTTDISKRNKGHKQEKGNKAFFSSVIKKYGWDNFSYDILCIVTTQEEADTAERENILLHNTLYPNGYNKTTGGKKGYQKL